MLEANRSKPNRMWYINMENIIPKEEMFFNKTLQIVYTKG